VEGVLSGLHKSPHQGQSVEFAEHKEYAPGDELRHLDWKAFGKFDKYYVKRYEHETNLRGILVVDGSASMGYGSGPLTKLQVSTTLAGALGYLLIRQQDAADRLAEKVRRRSLIAVFSDLFDDRQDALKRLLQLRARKNDLAIFHVMDP